MCKTEISREQYIRKKDLLEIKLTEWGMLKTTCKLGCVRGDNLNWYSMENKNKRASAVASPWFFWVKALPIKGYHAPPAACARTRLGNIMQNFKQIKLLENESIFPNFKHFHARDVHFSSSKKPFTVLNRYMRNAGTWEKVRLYGVFAYSECRSISIPSAGTFHIPSL